MKNRLAMDSSFKFQVSSFKFQISAMRCSLSVSIWRKLMVVMATLCACAPLRATATNEIAIEVAAPPPNVQLGFGWLQPERNDDFSFVWIHHLEGDLWVTLDSSSAADIELRAVPYYLNDRRQSIGLYVNERFITEWGCPYRAPWILNSYTARIPQGVLKPGRNRLTLRMSYRAGNKNSQYALAVNCVILRWL
jgi:hypothetical protein